MATIKIKFKNTLTLNKFDISINFSSNGKNYKNINTYQYPSGYALNYDTYTACFPGNSWTNEANKYIKIDTSQPTFNDFITAMKSNIEGVLLESGTYLWNNEQPFWGGEFPTSAETKIVKFNFTSNNIQFASCGVSTYGAGEFHFAYGKSTATTTGDTYLNSDVSSGKVVEVCNTEAYDLWGGTDLYRTIILDTDQYVDYDFYSNYVESKLNKQQPTPTAIKLFYHNNKLVSFKGKLLH